MGSPGTPKPIDAEIKGLEASYSFPRGRDRGRIVSLLRSNNRAITILKEAAGVLRSLFGGGAELCLELDRDPETGFEEIFATVRTAHSPEAGLSILERFDEEWWLGHLEGLAGKLNFDWEPAA